MRTVIKVVSFAAFLISITWVIYKPAFDSIFALITSLIVLLSSFLHKKALSKSTAVQSKNSYFKVGEFNIEGYDEAIKAEESVIETEKLNIKKK